MRGGSIAIVNFSFILQESFPELGIGIQFRRSVVQNGWKADSATRRILLRNHKTEIMATSDIVSHPEAPQTSPPEKVGSRRWLSIPLMLGALALGGASFGLLAQLKEEPELRQPVPKIYNVEVFPIQPTDIPESFPAYGSANADLNVTITAKVSGDVVASKDAFKHLHHKYI